MSFMSPTPFTSVDRCSKYAPKNFAKMGRKVVENVYPQRLSEPRDGESHQVSPVRSDRFATSLASCCPSSVQPSS